MIDTANEYCRQIADILSAHGVRTAYCSPGSRNVPLLVAMESCPSIETRVVVDERSCAFQALGHALVGRRPIALLCTSGTALLNFAPAVAEAYYSGVPLIVISADRPMEWIDQDDSQTIRQFGILSHIVKGNFDVRAIPEGNDMQYTHEMKWTINRIANEAMIKALDGKAGPVHINVQLAEPLGELKDVDRPHERTIKALRCSQSPDAASMREIAEIALDSKILVIAGFGNPDNKLNRAVKDLVSFPNVVLMAETLANIHVDNGESSMIDSVLSVMTESEKEAMRPDMVISFGGALVSRMLKKYIRDYPPSRHLSVGYSNYFGDCFKSMTDRIEIESSSFLRHLAASMRKIQRSGKQMDSDNTMYADAWLSMREYARTTADEYIKETPWSDLKALDYIFKNIGPVNLFVSNGTVVRYSQLIPHETHAEYCNRGVSGIDGSTATAVGGAEAYKGDTLLISGDMSWIYDSGASTLGNLPPGFRMIVIENGGGGIFRFISSTSSLPEHLLDRYLCYVTDQDISCIAKAYGIQVMESFDFDSLERGFKWIQQQGEDVRMMVIHTPPETSAMVLKGYFKRNNKSNL